MCFVLNDAPTPPGIVRVFQQLPPYVSYSPGYLVLADTLQLLVLGGTLFMSATDEEMHHANE